MPDHQPPSQTTVTESAAIAHQRHAHAEEDVDWLQEAEEPAELPPRTRRRLLTPLPLTLLAVLLLACGFIAGVLVQKGQGSSASAGSSGASGLAARFAALRGAGGAGAATGAGAAVASGASPTGAGTAGAGGASAGASGEGASGFAGRAPAGGATLGQVAFIKGSTLYVTDTAGNTIKVKAAAGVSITKTVSSSVKGIHPGESVLVTGTTASDGTVSAQSIRVGSGTRGLGGLFGRGSGAGASAGASGGAASSGEPALFGKG